MKIRCRFQYDIPFDHSKVLAEGIVQGIAEQVRNAMFDSMKDVSKAKICYGDKEFSVRLVDNAQFSYWTEGD